jgi:hypothetical protein
MPAALAALNLVARDLQQAAVHRVGNGLLLHRGVHDHAFQLRRLDGLDLHGRLDGELQQLLQTFFADGRAEAPDLLGVAWQARLVILHAAEELPDHVLTPASHQFFVAEIE